MEMNRAAPWLVERAASLVPMLQAQAAAAEQARRVSDATFDALSKAGIFLMTAPKRYGGAEADFQTQSEVLAQLARGCPSTSWVATIFSAMSWLAATFPDRAQEEIFGERQRHNLAGSHSFLASARMTASKTAMAISGNAR